MENMTPSDNEIIQALLDEHRPKLAEDAKTFLAPCMKLMRLPKRHVLVRELQTSGSVYLIITGSARSYYLQDGIEVHTWFAFEGELAGSLRNFNNLPSRETIELLEDSALLAFDIKALRLLMTENLQVSSFVQMAILEHALFLEDRIHRTHLRSANEKLAALLEHEPEILRRVPLTYIASYLGITRETLSRIRAK